MKFQTRLFAIWGLVVLLLWAGTWWPVRHAIDASFAHLAANEFSATRSDLHAQEAERVRSMRQAAGMLMNIPDLRALIAEHNFEVASENLASLQERLDNLAGIVGVSFVCVLDSRGNVIAQNHGSPWKTLPDLNGYLTTSPQGKGMVQTIFQGAARSATKVSADAVGMWSYHGRLFQAVGVPLVFNSDADSAPAADGGLIMATPLTDELAAGLAQSHKCEVSFLTGGSVAACSLPQRQREELEAAARTWPTTSGHTFDVMLSGISYRTSIDILSDGCSNLPVGAMLIQDDLNEAMAARKSVSTRLIASMVGGLLAAFLASFFVSGAITRPVRELARGVRRLAECDLDVQVNIRGRDELGQLAGTFNDMVRQLRVRRELERTVEEARATTKAKSEFLATMSHEIRTPLNGVIGMAELLLRSRLSDQQRRYAGMVKSSAEVLTTLINDILDFSKMEAGKLELESVDFNLHEMTEDVVELLATKAMTKGLDVACDIHADVASHVRGDPTRLRQVIVNLINNAIKFTDAGHVIVRLLPAHAADGTRQIRFEVIDSGIGIPADRMCRLFQSFSQVDASTTRRFGGTGLGLAISKQLVELMGGSIGVESEIGKGSTFRFNIPLIAASEIKTAEINPAALSGVRVLVVEENETCRAILCRKLAALGCITGNTSSAESATFTLGLARSQQLPYRVAIIDKHLAGASTIQTPAGLSVLWLVPLGGETDAIEADADADAAAAFVTKPVRRGQLANALLAVIEEIAPSPIENKADSMMPPAANAPKRRILLAEDNAVNQMIAVELLSSAGYACEVVGDGQAAVDAVVRDGFDLVLMDCQMPKMDGFQAARAIREYELKTSNSQAPASRIPIIALTANAGDGDRQRCVAAGMDEHCGKPFNVDQLLGAIARLLPRIVNDAPQMLRESIRTTPEPTTVESPDKPPFDVNLLLHHCTKNEKLALSVLAKFEQQSEELIRSLEESLQQSDFATIGRTSHRLRGTAGILAAEKLQSTAAAIEKLCDEGVHDGVSAAIATLHEEVQSCILYMGTARELMQRPKDGRTTGGHDARTDR